MPQISTSFKWTAKEVAKAAGKGAVYIWAQDDLDLCFNDNDSKAIPSDSEDAWM